MGKRLNNLGVTGRIGRSAVVAGKCKRPMPFDPLQERGEKKASTQCHVASTTIDCQTRRAPRAILARKAYVSLVNFKQIILDAYMMKSEKARVHTKRIFSCDNTPKKKRKYPKKENTHYQFYFIFYFFCRHPRYIPLECIR